MLCRWGLFSLFLLLTSHHYQPSGTRMERDHGIPVRAGTGGAESLPAQDTRSDPPRQSHLLLLRAASCSLSLLPRQVPPFFYKQLAFSPQASPAQRGLTALLPALPPFPPARAPRPGRPSTARAYTRAHTAPWCFSAGAQLTAPRSPGRGDKLGACGHPAAL